MALDFPLKLVEMSFELEVSGELRIQQSIGAWNDWPKGPLNVGGGHVFIGVFSPESWVVFDPCLARGRVKLGRGRLIEPTLDFSMAYSSAGFYAKSWVAYESIFLGIGTVAMDYDPMALSRGRVILSCESLSR
jgi:hypothetical protein